MLERGESFESDSTSLIMTVNGNIDGGEGAGTGVGVDGWGSGDVPDRGLDIVCRRRVTVAARRTKGSNGDDTWRRGDSTC
jgi:hypothetical protein